MVTVYIFTGHSGQMFVSSHTDCCCFVCLVCVKQPSSNSSAAVTEPMESNPMLGPESSVPKWEPMLCSEAEEGQAPLSLELLYSTAQSTSPSDAIMVAANLLMLEVGFIPQVRPPVASSQ